MSERIEPTLSVPVPAPEIAPAPVAAPVESSASPEPDAPAVEAAAPAAEPTHEEKKRAEADRRFARLTAKSAADRAALAKADAELTALRAQIAAQSPGEPEAAKPRAESVRAEAQRLVQEQRDTERRTSLIAEGAKEFGDAVWNEKTNIIASLGATENAAFMGALVEIPNGAKLVAALADDSDRLVNLLNKGPVAMAAEMGRIAAELDAPAPKRAVSTAPRPVTPVSGRGTPEPDVYDPKLSMKEYVAMRRKEAPQHLGGSARRSA